jgi:fatty-acyl-CoA synthase
MSSLDEATSALNWAAVLEHHAARFASRPAISFDGQQISYGELTDRVQGLARGLREHGIGRDAIVGLLSYNCAAYLEVMIAANYLGAIPMPINWRLAPAEIAYILDNSGAAMLFAEAGLSGLGSEAIARASGQIAAIGLDDTGTPGWTPLAELRSQTRADRPAAVSANDIHRLIYTSGTTSHPKGVVLTYGNLIAKNASHLVEFGFTGDDVGLVCGPMYHVGTLDATVTSMLAIGGSLVLHKRFSAGDVLREIEQSAITNVWLAPAMINQLLSHPDVASRDLSSLRLVVTGGEKSPETLIDGFARVFPNAWFADGYGLTESVSADCILPREDVRRKLGSVGRPLLYAELGIWDISDTPVKPGVTGEIVLRGPKLFREYWRDAAATAAAFRGGWFHTGDVGYLDEDGYLYIVDRLKDMIRSGGENIATPEVERVLYDHPAVWECAVVGRPDERWGEVPCAFVVLKQDAVASAGELTAHCTQSLAAFKVPRPIWIVTSLPRNPSGKVLKRELRDSARDALAPQPGQA